MSAATEGVAARLGVSVGEPATVALGEGLSVIEGVGATHTPVAHTPG